MAHKSIFHFLTQAVKSVIPGKYFPGLIDIKNNWLGEYGRRYYSQFGEDVILSKLLKAKDGFYVDVGAYHPKHFSNTHLLFKKGWRGINIDPNPYTIKLFNQQRKDDINLPIGISKERSSSVLYMFSHSNWNTFSKEKVAEWKERPGVHYLGEQEVQCLPLREVLDKHLPSGWQIDLLNVDAEGLDLVVLASNDWVKYKPKVIVIECSDFNPAHSEQSDVYSFLSAKNYALYVSIGLSLIFVRNE